MTFLICLMNAEYDNPMSHNHEKYGYYNSTDHHHKKIVDGWFTSLILHQLVHLDFVALRAQLASVGRREKNRQTWTDRVMITDMTKLQTHKGLTSSPSLEVGKDPEDKHGWDGDGVSALL